MDAPVGGSSHDALAIQLPSSSQRKTKQAHCFEGGMAMDLLRKKERCKLLRIKLQEVVSSSFYGIFSDTFCFLRVSNPAGT